MIFIVGVGRSGTSLLQSILNAHSKICFVPEINYIRRFLVNNTLEKRFRRQGNDAIVDMIAKDRLINRLNLDIINILKNINFDGHNISYEIYCILLKKYLQKEKKEIIGDKNPRSIEYLPIIKKYFPDVLIINIIRDPRDVLLSKMKADWSKNRSMYLHILINEIQLRLGIKYKYIFGNNYHEIYYEKLLKEPKETITNICDFIGVDYEETMLEYSESAKQLVTNDELQWKKETLGPLLINNYNKWHSKLSNWQITLIEENVKTAFKHYNYTKSNPELSLMQRYLIVITKIIYNIGLNLFIIGK